MSSFSDCLLRTLLITFRYITSTLRYLTLCALTLTMVRTHTVVRRYSTTALRYVVLHSITLHYKYITSRITLNLKVQDVAVYIGVSTIAHA